MMKTNIEGLREDIRMFKEGSKMMKDTAKLFDEMVAVLEDENLDETEREEKAEAVLGRLVIAYVKSQKLLSWWKKGTKLTNE